MLDHVSISHQSGVILWSRSFTPTFAALAMTPASPVNALIREVMIEGKARTEDEGFEKDGYSIRWTMENRLGLVFVVVFPALLPLAYIPALLQRTKQLFLSLFQPYLESLVDALSDRSGPLAEGSRSALRILGQQIVDQRWDAIFDRCLKNQEATSGRKGGRIMPARQAQLANTGDQTPHSGDEAHGAVSAEEIAKNVQALKGRMKGRKGRGRDGMTPSPVPSPRKASGAQAKLMRKWGDTPVSDADMAALDYSSPAPENVTVDVDALVSQDALGKRTATGNYEVADWDFGRGKKSDLPSEEDILARRTEKLTIADDEEPAPESAWTSMLSRLSGKKAITKEDLRPVIAEMEKHLMSKNVAKDISEKLCDGVASSLVGKKLGGLSSVKSEVEKALSASMTRILTPKTSTDLLVDIQRKRSQPGSLSAPDAPPDPYTLTFVGVNGVGKSTNLSKVCFWLLQNGLRVLIAACDTFRSGAVEQLRVHVRNLGALGDEMGMGVAGDAPDGSRRIELYERGYGKDAAGIAKDAIAYAKEHRFDVVLIDTAGRMQDNEPLMRALAKLVTVNNPDKIIFVGEALVGNEAVDQLTKFDRALKDFSGAGAGAARRRGIDGILLTKFDTIDDKVGAALSMTYVTGQPILFVGCGQTYTDLRHLRVNHIVQALLSA
ncbi:P-loop containing nucleoside triphosphate hydrolase protein [Cutaneotrichosporon oleaginosum]|uniref:p-loop containing nucleoside triphosphate hydrolase protein n=1 Tax=Cutaneotrichosporon oleaginosum TaxID=879819 RepID=A0A0J0XFD2_9TREE|nr:P-loop containing nucleoside triphosphate hydrolase protein [Cutaneotrichosporon oleaginosum]KLT39800.1 P-loop containing nucleoside triphosphate hydrolase protein [Cutaneotrichosporon oleaginosum]TXT10325.1 hypothetical protein COLE_04259 [Cutaneotrichosporon oleaginosum]